MKNLIFTGLLLTITLTLSAKSLEDEVVSIDCFAYADAIEGAYGDAGDIDVWWNAFVQCSGVEEVVISR